MQEFINESFEQVSISQWFWGQKTLEGGFQCVSVFTSFMELWGVPEVFRRVLKKKGLQGVSGGRGSSKRDSGCFQEAPGGFRGRFWWGFNYHPRLCWSSSYADSKKYPKIAGSNNPPVPEPTPQDLMISRFQGTKILKHENTLKLKFKFSRILRS